MSNSEYDDREQTAEIIRTLRVQNLPDNAALTVKALLNAIPYAGGSISSVLGEQRTSEQMQKVCDTLELIHKRVSSSESKVENLLTKDEVAEVMGENLAAIARCSDSEKVRLLQTGLAEAFGGASHDYSSKQFFLDTLRDLSPIEIRVLRCIYLGADPYERGPETNTHDGFGLSVHSAALVFKEWMPDGGPALIEHIRKTVGAELSVIVGVVASLDRRNLTNVQANADSTHTRLMRRQSMEEGVSVVAPTPEGQSKYKGTPIELSRTDFGRSFLKFFGR